MTAPLLRHINDEMLDSFFSLDALYLATESNDGLAEPSYAPFVEADKNLYIYISELASHTVNILQKKYAGVLLIEDAEQARNPFARKRLSLHCEVSDIARQTPEYEQAVQQLTDKYGNTMDVLKTLGDFHLIKLIPLNGTLVEGFGKTSLLDQDGLRRWTKN